MLKYFKYYSRSANSNMIWVSVAKKKRLAMANV